MKINVIGARSRKLEMQVYLHSLFSLGKISCDCFIEQLRASKQARQSVSLEISAYTHTHTHTHMTHRFVLCCQSPL